MRLGLRLPLAFVVLLVLSAMAGLFGIQRLNSSLGVYAQVIGSDFALVRQVNLASAAFRDQVQNWNHTLLRGVDLQERNHYWAETQKDQARVRTIMQDVRSRVAGAALQGLIDQFIAAHANMSQSYQKGLDAFVAAGFDPVAGDGFAKGQDRQPNQLLAKIADGIVAQSQQAVEEAASQRSRANTASLAALAVVLGLGVAGGLWVTRGIVREIGGEPDDARRVSRRIAEGDLSVNVQVNTGDSRSLMATMRNMCDGLAAIVLAVRESSNTLVEGSSDIAGTSGHLSEATDEQSRILAETAQAAAQLSSAVSENTRSAGEASAMARSASEVTRQGGEVMGRVVQTMKGINESSRKIVDIVGVIDGIAFQTNILALNAAVEAARAGEQGRGFAVVASEVRTLAQRSASAAREIKGLIDASVARVDEGSRLVDQAGSTMQEIVASIQRVSDTLSNISGASERQSQGVSQVDASIVQLGDVTRRNADLAAEGRAAAQRMHERAAELATIVARFTLPGKGRGAPS